MKELSTYRGHSIDLDMKRLAGDCFRWTYFIDASYCMQGIVARSDIQAARDYVLVLARQSIETLDPMTPSLPGEGRAMPHPRDRERRGETLVQDDASHEAARAGA